MKFNIGDKVTKKNVKYVVKYLFHEESFKTINKENLNQEVVLGFMIMEKLFPRSLKYCVDKLIEVQKFLPQSTNIKKITKSLLKNLEKNNVYKYDKKILKHLDNFQFGLIKLDKEINERFFSY